jgi:hypothetical protein
MSTIENSITTDAQIQFEEGYIFRNNRSVTSTPDIAITEFVANAWDAGAYNVSITIPEEDGDIISIEDDGIGMSDTEFRQVWMTLNYDRQKRQGGTVIFPPDVENYKRIAYGRNGIGRHGMLCFADYYTVETWLDGLCNKYEISVSSGNEPFKITNWVSSYKEGHGTTISAYVHRHLPNALSMTDIISTRFLYDPKFIVKINGHQVDLLNHKGIHLKKEIKLDDGVKIHLTIIDSTKTANKSQQHGIAFWVGGRLVGKPSWTYGDFQFLDGRYKIAKRYTLIAQTDDLMDEVLPDWTGFLDSQRMNNVYVQFKTHVDEFISSIMTEQVSELKMEIIRDSRDELEALTLLGQRDVSKFLDTITKETPTISPEFLKTAFDAVIQIEKAKNGEQLLNQLCMMSPDEIDKLSDLLREWDVDDILSIIAEIDKRINVVEAIDRVFRDKKTDELHTLHPLVLNARWLFGPEFDSPMFVSNSALTTIVKQLFKTRIMI